MEGFIRDITNAGSQSKLLSRMAATAKFLPNLACVKELLKTPGINVNEKTEAGNTALINACSLARETSCMECVTLLLNDKRVDVNAQNQNGKTALFLAVRAQSGIPVVERLLSHPDIDVNLKDKHGWSPLAYAARYHKRNTFYVNLLLRCPDINVNSRDKNEWTPLMNACRNVCNGESSVEIVKLLLNHPKIDPNHMNDLCSTTLSFAVQYTDLDTIKLLLDHPKIIPREQIVRCAFYNVSQDLLVEVIQLFIKSGKVDMGDLWRCLQRYRFRIDDDKVQQMMIYVMQLFATNSLETFTIPCLCGTRKHEIDSITESLATATHLKSVYMNDCQSHESSIFPHVAKSFSICATGGGGGHNFMKQYPYVLVRNRIARKKCFDATIYTLWAFRKTKLGKDVVKIIARKVWATRGARLWCPLVEQFVLDDLQTKYGDKLQGRYESLLLVCVE